MNHKVKVAMTYTSSREQFDRGDDISESLGLNVTKPYECIMYQAAIYVAQDEIVNEAKRRLDLQRFMVENIPKLIDEFFAVKKVKLTPTKRKIKMGGNNG